MADEDSKNLTCEIQDGAPVIPIGGYNAAQPARLVAELRSYWDGLRQGRAVPMRTDVQPAGIGRGLDFAFILERIAPGAARFRLAGRHIVDLMGMEVRGMPLCSVLNAGSRGRLSDVLETVFRGPQLADLTLISPAGYGRPQLHGRMLILPLKSDLGDVSRALGCLVTAGEIGRGPRRFDLLEEQVEPVIPGACVLSPKPSRHDLADQVDPGPLRPTPAARAAGGARRESREVSLPLLPEIATTPESRRAMFRVVTSDPQV